jgi:hypothetical protein
MKRLSTRFYKEFNEHRQSYGHAEYDVEDLITAAIPILKKYLGDDAETLLQIDLLTAINERIEARENDPLQGELFAHNAHTALGERRRIKRGRMTADHVLRRKLIIDRNHKVQNNAWAVETDWLNDTIAALRGAPATTVREDVLNEDGTVKILEPA